MGQSGYLHCLPPLRLLLQGGDLDPTIPCFELIPLLRRWYFATGGWPPWSRSCSSSSNTRSSISFPTSQSAGEDTTIIPAVKLYLFLLCLKILHPHHENSSKLYLRWDHWILDVLICNLGGTIIGIYTLRYFSKSKFDLLKTIATLLIAGGCDWRLITGGVSTKFRHTGVYCAMYMKISHRSWYFILDKKLYRILNLCLQG